MTPEEGLAADQLEFDVYCSKGTYIRTLAADIAVRLGTIGYVKGLRRLSVDPFGDLPMFTLESLSAESPESLGARSAGGGSWLLPTCRAWTWTASTEVQPAARPAGQPAEPGSAGRITPVRRERPVSGAGRGLEGGRVKPSRLFVAWARPQVRR